MEIFAQEGDLSSEIRLMKMDNVTVTDFFDDYVHVHNTQTSLISRRIMKEASLYIIQETLTDKYLICVHDDF